MRKTDDILASLIFLLIGIFVTIKGIGLGVGALQEPQPGFFLLVSGGILTILSAIFLVCACLGHSKGIEAFGELRRPIILIMGLAVYTMILDLTGYIIATIILSLIIQYILGTRQLWKLAAHSLIVSLGTYFMFDRLLGLSLPSGILARVM